MATAVDPSRRRHRSTGSTGAVCGVADPAGVGPSAAWAVRPGAEGASTPRHLRGGEGADQRRCPRCTPTGGDSHTTQRGSCVLQIHLATSVRCRPARSAADLRPRGAGRPREIDGDARLEGSQLDDQRTGTGSQRGAPATTCSMASRPDGPRHRVPLGSQSATRAAGRAPRGRRRRAGWRRRGRGDPAGPAGSASNQAPRTGGPGSRPCRPGRRGWPGRRRGRRRRHRWPRPRPRPPRRRSRGRWRPIRCRGRRRVAGGRRPRSETAQLDERLLHHLLGLRARDEDPLGRPAGRGGGTPTPPARTAGARRPRAATDHVVDEGGARDGARVVAAEPATRRRGARRPLDHPAGLVGVSGDPVSAKASQVGRGAHHVAPRARSGVASAS